MYHSSLAMTHCVYRAAVKKYLPVGAQKIRARNDNSI